MASRPPRDLLKRIFVNFFNSFKPRRISGDLMGEDYNGNTYYEIPPQGNRSKPSRYFVPPGNKDFESEIPAEWDSWLRLRRQEPPSDEELEYNLSIMKMKKENAAILEVERIKELEARGLPTAPAIRDKGTESYPRYKEFDGGDMDRHDPKHDSDGVKR